MKWNSVSDYGAKSPQFPCYALRPPIKSHRLRLCVHPQSTVERNRNRQIVDSTPLLHPSERGRNSGTLVIETIKIIVHCVRAEPNSIVVARWRVRYSILSPNSYFLLYNFSLQFNVGHRTARSLERISGTNAWWISNANWAIARLVNGRRGRRCRLRVVNSKWTHGIVVASARPQGGVLGQCSATHFIQFLQFSPRIANKIPDANVGVNDSSEVSIRLPQIQ